MISAWLWSLGACQPDVAADFKLTIRPHLLPDQEKEVLALAPDVKLLLIPSDGGPPTVLYAGVAEAGKPLEIDGLGPIPSDTTIGLALETPGGDTTLWNRRATVAYGDAPLEAALDAGGYQGTIDILAQRVDAFAKVAKFSGANRKLGGAVAILPDGRAALFGGGDPDDPSVTTYSGTLPVVSSDSILVTGPTDDGWAHPAPAAEPMPTVTYPGLYGDPPVTSSQRADAVAIPVETDGGWKMLVTGGRYTYWSSSYNLTDWFLWDPDKGEVEQSGELQISHSSHLVIPLGPKVLVYGGFEGAGIGGPSAYDILNVQTGKTVAGAHASTIDGNFAAYGTALGNKAVVCASGYNVGNDASRTVTPRDTCAKIDSQDRVTPLAQLPEPVLGGSIAPLPDGGLLVTGGTATEIVGDATLVDATNHAWRWNPKTDEWRSVGKLVHARGYHKSTLLPDGRVLVVGGVDKMGGWYGPSGAAVRCSEAFDPDEEVFTETACDDAGSGQEAGFAVAPGYVVALEGLVTTPSSLDGGGTLGVLRTIPDLPEE